MDTAKNGTVGKGGTIVLPARLRRQYGLKEGSRVIAEAKKNGILIRSVAVPLLESYTLERRAQFLLNNATDALDYARAVKEVRKLGLDPKKIPHRKPSGG